MAKEDFCFTYYDGDALRDMSHMNRLERGAYNDFVLQQRKFGRMNLEQIKKILGKDFEECWPALNLVLIFTESDKTYHLEWLEESIAKMRKHSKKQSENVTKRYQQSTKRKPKTKVVTPLEDGDGDESEKIKNNKSKKTKIVLPFPTEAFIVVWEKWKIYRNEIKKPYRSVTSEQTALDRLGTFSEGVAIQMIEVSIENQWQGIFELKPNEIRKPTSSKNDRTEFNQNELAIIQQHASRPAGSKL